MFKIFSDEQFSKALFWSVVVFCVTLNVMVSSFVHPLKQLTPIVFFVPLNVIEVSFLHPLKQLWPKVLPVEVLKETEVKFEQELKQLLLNDFVALFRFSVSKPVQPVKTPLLPI